VRNVTSRAALCLDGSVFKNERPLFVGVAFYAGGISAGGQSRLFQLKTAVRVVAIATLHRAFKHFVMKRRVELMFDFRMAAQTKLRIIHLQHRHRGKARLLSIGTGNKHIRARQIPACDTLVRRVAVSTADVVAPVFTAPEVVVFFPARMTGETSFGDFFGRLVLEGNNLRRITFFGMRLTRSMTRLTACYFLLPGTQLSKLGMRCVRVVLKLIFVAIFAGVAADVARRLKHGAHWFGILAGTNCLRAPGRSGPKDQAQYRPAEEQRLNGFGQFQFAASLRGKKGFIVCPEKRGVRNEEPWASVESAESVAAYFRAPISK